MPKCTILSPVDAKHGNEFIFTVLQRVHIDSLPDASERGRFKNGCQDVGCEEFVPGMKREK